MVESVRDVTDELRSYLGSDPLRNAFVLHDLSHETARTELWTARVYGQLRAHLLVHDALQVPQHRRQVARPCGPNHYGWTRLHCSDLAADFSVGYLFLWKGSIFLSRPL